MLITTIGISGAGKSTLIKGLQVEDPSLEVVWPDEIRRELTGSVSDQSQNEQVFKIAYQRTFERLLAGKDVAFDATNLDIRSLKQLKSIAIECETSLKIFVLTDSFSVENCYQRVHQDLRNNVDRAATIHVPGLLKKQNAKFHAVMAKLRDFTSDDRLAIEVVAY